MLKEYVMTCKIHTKFKFQCPQIKFYWIQTINSVNRNQRNVLISQLLFKHHGILDRKF